MKSEPGERRRAASGAAAIEFAIIAPVLLIMLGAIVELGLGFRQAMQVQEACEAGALYTAQHGWDQAGISTAVVNAISGAGISASPAPRLFCGCPNATGVTEISCATTCSGGVAAGQYVEISASAPRVVVLTSGLPVPSTITGKSVVRIQ
jgi:Flp pilus assembly protein TadG